MMPASVRYWGGKLLAWFDSARAIWFLMGVFLSTTSFFWVSSATAVKTVAYTTVMFSGVLVLVRSPLEVLSFVRGSPLFCSILAFLSWFVASMTWSDAGWDHDNVKQSLLILFFLTAFSCASVSTRVLSSAFFAACLVVVLALMHRIYAFYFVEMHPFRVRLIYGDIADNPLKIGALAGFCFVYLFSIMLSVRLAVVVRLGLFLMLTVLVLFLCLSQARSILIALTLAMVVMVVMTSSRWRWFTTVAIIAAAIAGWWFFQDVWRERGGSYRTDIWWGAFAQMEGHWWRGLGLDNRFSFTTHDGLLYNDVHSLYVFALQSGGIIGSALLLGMFGAAGVTIFRLHQSALRLFCAGLMVFVLIYWSTNSPNIINRFNEVWFALWVPFAAILYLSRVPNVRSLLGVGRATEE